MDLSDGKYLGKEICAFSGTSKSMWLVVYDGKYNYYLFNTWANNVIRMYKRNRMPANDSAGGTKYVEFYSTFDNAFNNLVKVVVNNGFLKSIKVVDGGKYGKWEKQNLL